MTAGPRARMSACGPAAPTSPRREQGGARPADPACTSAAVVGPGMTRWLLGRGARARSRSRTAPSARPWPGLDALVCAGGRRPRRDLAPTWVVHPPPPHASPTHRVAPRTRSTTDGTPSLPPAMITSSAPGPSTRKTGPSSCRRSEVVVRVWVQPSLKVSRQSGAGPRGWRPGFPSRRGCRTACPGPGARQKVAGASLQALDPHPAPPATP